ncbi:contractile injection system protein, VgrG/Pvc8 family [Alkaliphilus crotonatoxidans]
MQSMESYHKIKLKGAFPIQHIEELEILHQLNQHSTMKLTGILEETNVDEFIAALHEESTIEITLDQEEDNILFSGIPTEIQVEHRGGISYIKLQCLSATYKMDIDPQSRSFQNKAMTLDQILEAIVKEYPQGDYINTAAPHQAIDTIQLQYKETDWEFLKRMASTLGTILVPDISAPKPRFWFGLPQAQKTALIQSQDHTLRQYAETQADIRGYYYEIELSERLGLGDQIKLNKIGHTITRIHIQMEKSLLKYTYRIQRPTYIKTKARVNEKLKGISLPGKVIDVARNQLKIHLDIDPGQTKEEAHWFPYSPEANNAWYSMPHMGTKINLYFPNTNPSQAMAITTERGGRAEKQKNPNMEKTTEKIFETKWGKELKLKEDHINIETGLMNVKLDENSIEVVSNDKIIIQAANDLNIGKTITKAIIEGKETEIIKESKNITIEAEELITLKVNSTSSSVELDIDNRLSSQLVLELEGDLKSPLPMIESEGQQAKQQAEEEARALEEEKKKQEEQQKEAAKNRKKLGLKKILGAAVLALTAVAVVSMLPAIAAGAMVVGTMAAAATGVAGLVTATVVAAKVVAVGSVAVMGAMALSDTAEGVQEIAHGFKEDTQTESFNFARDLAFAGDEQNYATFQQGMMFLAMLQISFAQPYQQARKTASSANEKAMKENKSSQFSGNQIQDGRRNGVVQSRINIANGQTRFTPLRETGKPVSAGFDHVRDGHFNRPLANSRSIFTIKAENLKEILQRQDVVRSQVTVIEGGQYVRVVDVGQIVGNTALKYGGGETTWIKIFTDKAGNLITTYPVPAP